MREIFLALPKHQNLYFTDDMSKNQENTNSRKKFYSQFRDSPS